MNEILRNVTGLAGVKGVALFDPTGSCVHHELEAPYDPELCGQVLQELQVGLEPFGYVNDSSFEKVLARTSDGVLVVRRMESFLALIIGEQRLNPVMVEVALNGVALKLKNASSEPAKSSVPEAQAPPTPGPPANPVPGRAIHSSIQALAKQLGPIAKIVWKQEAEKLGAAATAVDRAHFSDLVERVAGKIEDSGKRKVFLDEVGSLGI